MKRSSIVDKGKFEDKIEFTRGSALEPCCSNLTCRTQVPSRKLLLTTFHAMFFGHHSQPSALGNHQFNSNSEFNIHSPHSTVVQQMNYGEIFTEVYDANYGEETYRNSPAHSGSVYTV